jgi:hypothetical protein
VCTFSMLLERIYVNCSNVAGVSSISSVAPSF